MPSRGGGEQTTPPPWLGNGPQVPNMLSKFPLCCIELISDTASRKRIYAFYCWRWTGLKLINSSSHAAMMTLMNILPSHQSVLWLWYRLLLLLMVKHIYQDIIYPINQRRHIGISDHSFAALRPWLWCCWLLVIGLTSSQILHMNRNRMKLIYSSLYFIRFVRTPQINLDQIFILSCS